MTTRRTRKGQVTPAAGDGSAGDGTKARTKANKTGRNESTAHRATILHEDRVWDQGKISPANS